MKKIIIGSLAALLASGASLKAQETENTNVEAVEAEPTFAEGQIAEQFNEVAQKLGSTVETGVKAFGAALGTMVDSLTKTMTMAKVCSDEDQKAPMLTLTQVEEIIKAIAPDQIQNFKVNTMQKSPIDFAKAEFSKDNTDFVVEIAKSYCLTWMDEMTAPMEEMPDKMQAAVANIVPEQANETNANSAKETSKGSYNICGDSIDIDKFNKLALDNWEVKVAFDEENKSAYAFGIINTLGIKTKTHGDNAQEAIKQFYQAIDVAGLQQVLGGQNTDEIKNMLQQKYQEALKNIPQNNAFDAMTEAEQ